MAGLYKKVIKGVYPKIPTHFSQDLNNTVKILMVVTPSLRPSCE
jgi:NIMA (never in mitosis gene a)-related kinase